MNIVAPGVDLEKLYVLPTDTFVKPNDSVADIQRGDAFEKIFPHVVVARYATLRATAGGKCKWLPLAELFNDPEGTSHLPSYEVCLCGGLQRAANAAFYRGGGSNDKSVKASNHCLVMNTSKQNHHDAAIPLRITTKSGPRPLFWGVLQLRSGEPKTVDELRASMQHLVAKTKNKGMRIDGPLLHCVLTSEGLVRERPTQLDKVPMTLLNANIIMVSELHWGFTPP
jgi:hypothetical protein